MILELAAYVDRRYGLGVDLIGTGRGCGIPRIYPDKGLASRPGSADMTCTQLCYANRATEPGDVGQRLQSSFEADTHSTILCLTIPALGHAAIFLESYVLFSDWKYLSSVLRQEDMLCCCGGILLAGSMKIS